MLAAAGETLWHAHAAASEGRWAAPGIGAAAALTAAEAAAIAGANESALAEVNASASAEMTEEVNSMTAPIFKPFVLVELELPSGYDSGSVMAINDAGQAVGWMRETSSGLHKPFFFDPASGGNTVTALNLTGATAGEAWGISNASTPLIVGWATFSTTPNYDGAAKWSGSGGTLANVLASGVVSQAYDVNDSGRIVGMYVSSGNPRSFVNDSGGTQYPAATSDSEALAVDSSGNAVGWLDISGDAHAYRWISSTGVTHDIHPSAWSQSVATCTMGATSVAGYVIDNSYDPSYRVPSLATLSITPALYTTTPFESGASSMVTGLNSSDEMVITRVDGTSGVALWQRVSGANVSNNLGDLALMRNSADVLDQAWDINDDLSVGGAYKPGGTGDPQPCLIIPYDVDNDGEPDYREMVANPSLDDNDNWLLDWAENISGSGMRTGLHSPPLSDNPPHEIDEAQIVRLQIFLQGPQQGPGLDGIDEFTIEEAIDGPNGFCEGVKRWSRDNVDREIVVWLRSTLNRTGYSWTKDNDILPEDSTQRAQILSDLLAFSHHYAHCIDYIQLGNEVFGGAGQYMFTDDELSSCGTWSDFEEWGDLSNSCKAVASPIVLDWLDDLMWASLEGSALAGRPYRIVSPAMLGSHVRSGHGNSSTVAFQVIDGVSEWANERQMFFDLHVHYESYALFTETTQKITDTYGGSAGWDVPHRIVVLEWGPTANTGWVTANSVDYGKFREESGCEDPPSYEDWEDFVATWKADQNQPWQGDFSIVDSLDDMAALGFHFVCYGPVGQHENANLKYDMKCLWANKTCDEFITDEDFITPMKAEFVAAATEHQITFSTRISCPDCPGN